MTSNKPAIRMLLLIINYKDIKKAHAIFASQKAPAQYLCTGEGTVTNEIIDLLGLGVSEKAILFCPVLKTQMPALFDALTEGLSLHKPNRGCAFTFPISGASAYIMKILTSSELFHEEQKEEKKEEHQMIHETKHSLLIVTINQGFSEEVMTAATTAGAAGGTVVHARRLDSKETMKKWGISIQPEKEMVYILVEQDKKTAIMKAISEQCGLLSQAQGILIAIPVDNVVGLNTDSPL
ncbi:transposase [Enterococcus dongliensis]|uniref:transposase n=1 Tax=Enterococcus dongliensis TaxID=2559925 RepID=UPI00289025FF|nr:transposase [Enterococcus dongliensis]MDT2673748.1 transposase [Enterococcus dongliensis]